MFKSSAKIWLLLLFAVAGFFIGHYVLSAGQAKNQPNRSVVKTNFKPATIKTKPKPAVKGIKISKSNTLQQLTAALQATGATISYADAKKSRADFVQSGQYAIPLSVAQTDPAKVAVQYLNDYGPVLGVANLGNKVQALGSVTDAQGFIHAYNVETYNNVPIYGATVQVDMNPQHQVFASATNVWPIDKNFSVTPTLSAAQAAAIASSTAISQYGAKNPIVSAPQLNIFNEYYINDGAGVDQNLLVWGINILEPRAGNDRTILIDARLGRVVRTVNNIVTDMERQVFNCVNGSVKDSLSPCYGDNDYPVNDKNTAGRFEGGDKVSNYNVNAVYDDLGFIHDWYYSNFQINAANGYGGTTPKFLTNSDDTNLDIVYDNMVSLDDYCGTPALACYIPDSGSIMMSTTSNIYLVVAHEFTHAVISGLKMNTLQGTANEVNPYLNEGLANFFGVDASTAQSDPAFWSGLFNPNILTVFDALKYEPHMGGYGVIGDLAYFLVNGTDSRNPGYVYKVYENNKTVDHYCPVFPLDKDPNKAIEMVKQIFFKAMYYSESLESWHQFYLAANSACQQLETTKGYSKVACDRLDQAMKGAQFPAGTYSPNAANIDNHFCTSLPNDVDEISDGDYCLYGIFPLIECGIVTRTYMDGRPSKQVDCGKLNASQNCKGFPEPECINNQCVLASTKENFCDERYAHLENIGANPPWCGKVSGYDLSNVFWDNVDCHFAPSCQFFEHCAVGVPPTYEDSGYPKKEIANICYTNKVLSAPGGYRDSTGASASNGGYYNIKKLFGPASPIYITDNLNFGSQAISPQSNDNGSKYCYKNQSDNCDRYGGLYTWAGINHCPQNFRVMSKADFVAIQQTLGDNAGAAAFGGDFNAQASGYYSQGNYSPQNIQAATYWTTDENSDDKTQAWAVTIDKNKGFSYQSADKQSNDYSVRCIQDCQRQDGTPNLSVWINQGDCVLGADGKYTQAQVHPCNPAPACGGICPSSGRSIPCTPLVSYIGKPVAGEGGAYAADGSLPDTHDGGYYPSVVDCNDTTCVQWLAANTNAGNFVKTTDTGSPSNPKYCLDDDPAACQATDSRDSDQIVGGLYDGDTVSSKNNLCPVGYAVATQDDYKSLVAVVGANSAIKLADSAYCQGQTSCDLSGLHFTPGGYLNLGATPVTFSGQGAIGSYWAPGSYVAPQAFNLDFSELGANQEIYNPSSSFYSPNYGGIAASVRCVALSSTCSQIAHWSDWQQDGQCYLSSGSKDNSQNGYLYVNQKRTCTIPTDFKNHPHCGSLVCAGPATRQVLAPDQPTWGPWFNDGVCQPNGQQAQKRNCNQPITSACQLKGKCAPDKQGLGNTRTIPCNAGRECGSFGSYIAGHCWYDGSYGLANAKLVVPETSGACHYNNDWAYYLSSANGDWSKITQQSNDNVLEEYCAYAVVPSASFKDAERTFDYSNPVTYHDNTEDVCIGAAGALLQWAEAMQLPFAYNSKTAAGDNSLNGYKAEQWQGVCQKGYHIPNLQETMDLADHFASNPSDSPSHYFPDIIPYYFGGYVKPTQNWCDGFRQSPYDITFQQYPVSYDAKTNPYYTTYAIDPNQYFNFWTSDDEDFSDGHYAQSYYSLTHPGSNLATWIEQKRLGFPVMCVQNESSNYHKCQADPPQFGITDPCYIIGPSVILDTGLDASTYTANYDWTHWNFVAPDSDSQVLKACTYTCAPGCSYQGTKCLPIKNPCVRDSDCNFAPTAKICLSTSTIQYFLPQCLGGQCAYATSTAVCKKNTHCADGQCYPDNSVVNRPGNPTTIVPYNPPTPGYVTPTSTGPTPPVTPTGPANQNCLGTFPPVPTNYATQFRYGKLTSANPVAWFYDCSTPAKDCSYCCINGSPSSDFTNCNGNTAPAGGMTGAVKGVKIQKTWWQNILQWLGL